MSPALLLALTLQTAAPAPAPPVDPAHADPARGAAAASDDDKTVCRREQATGSRMFSNTCFTKRQWREREQQSQNEINQQRTLNGPH